MLQTLDFQTMNSVRSNNQSLKYQRFTTLSSKDIEVLIFDFVPKTQFLRNLFYFKIQIFPVFLKLHGQRLGHFN